MSLLDDIAAMNTAAGSLERIGSPAWAQIMRDVARAAEQTTRQPVSTTELMRWSPVTLHIAHIARQINTSVSEILPPVTTLRPVDENASAEGGGQ